MPNPPPGFEWDEAKAQWNLRVHGISFAAVKDFDFAGGVETEDLRHDYGEIRFFSIGRLRRALHVLVYARPQDKVIRVISLRKANAQERAVYFAAGGQ